MMSNEEIIEPKVLPSLDIKSILGDSKKFNVNDPAKPIKKNKMGYIKEFQHQVSKLKINPISCKGNCEGNYDKYLEDTLSHLAIMSNINFEYALEDSKLSVNVPNLIKIEKKIVLLDLDETLVHADFDLEYENDPKIKYDTIIKFISNKIEEDEYGRILRKEPEEISVGIFIRNGVQEFLKEVSKYFYIGIFTASVKEYADAVIDFLDPQKKLIKFRLYRNNCIQFNNCFSVKDLRILNVDLKNVILIDNNIYSFAAQITNGILINSFYVNKNDYELDNVLNYLLNFILCAEDVRKVNEQFFNFQKITNELKCVKNQN